MQFERIQNSIKIVGKLMDAQVTTGNRKDNGQGYISVDATVVSQINGVSNEYKVNFYTSQLTKDGKYVSRTYVKLFTL